MMIGQARVQRPPYFKVPVVYNMSYGAEVKLETMITRVGFKTYMHSWIGICQRSTKVATVSKSFILGRQLTMSLSRLVKIGNYHSNFPVSH